MTATLSPTTVGTTADTSLWRPGLKAAAVAAVATTSVAVLAHAAGVSFESNGEAIPVLGFAQLTLVFSVIGIVIARSIGRRAAQPRSTWVRTAVALTALSFVPDLMLSTDVASKLTLMLTHVVAALIVIPAVASRLAERRSH